MHELPDLPYSHDALEPHVDERTMQIHHGKHHAGYVKKLNAALEEHPRLADRDVDDLLRGIQQVPENIRTAVRNNGGGHSNHSLFWTVMSPDGGGEPSGDLADAIESAFGGFSDFKGTFSDAASGRFGSGWAWLVIREGNLDVLSTPNQDSPLMEGLTPVLGLDVWEHAYYLNYQNRRGDYIDAWWNVVDWAAVGERYEKARS